MKQRIITAAVLLCLFIPVVCFSHTVVFAAAMTLLSVAASYEMLHCIGVEKKLYFAIPSYLLALCPMIPYVTYGKDAVSPYPLLCAISAVYLIYLLTVTVFARGELRFEVTASVFTSVLYVVITFSSIVALRYADGGEYIYLLVFLGPWVSDTFAYFCGMLFGKHKLIPEVSPKKTVEGSIGGIVFTAVGFVVYGLIVSRITDGGMELNYVLLAVTGMIVSVISQIGDLSASLIKRNYGIKDYGFIFPGHGGVLDRFDSVLLTAPVLLIVCSLTVYR